MAAVIKKLDTNANSRGLNHTAAALIYATVAKDAPTPIINLEKQNIIKLLNNDAKTNNIKPNADKTKEINPTFLKPNLSITGPAIKSWQNTTDHKNKETIPLICVALIEKLLIISLAIKLGDIFITYLFINKNELISTTIQGYILRLYIFMFNVFF